MAEQINTAAIRAKLIPGVGIEVTRKDCERIVLIDSLLTAYDAQQAEIARLRGLMDAPEIDDFLLGVKTEQSHQIERWGAEHDEEKTSLDWFWLIGYLAQKAAYAAIAEDYDKARHHCISTAAVLYHWHSLMGLRAEIKRSSENAD